MFGWKYQSLVKPWKCHFHDSKYSGRHPKTPLTLWHLVLAISFSTCSKATYCSLSASYFKTVQTALQLWVVRQYLDTQFNLYLIFPSWTLTDTSNDSVFIYRQNFCRFVFSSWRTSLWLHVERILQ